MEGREGGAHICTIVDIFFFLFFLDRRGMKVIDSESFIRATNA